ncbi:ribosomal protein L6 [Eremomyces bilateralis CBS 781.70]|uniref:Ribosomal protein L6 n=1 Tax=Eremomyces bilateralis CBS 781.70 TaxID=1392243 RepID=A0A6G1G6H7_9PEZI|nr:ribosomal protein L6 [Eremomyces bilateralis CBS 781.70]KAF1813439.1 ribosomal protein L6 [Eremomyces bilateralis CBS 781.70]
MIILKRAAFGSSLSTCCKNAATTRAFAVRQFTVSSRRESKIGGMVLSIPPEVTFDVLPPTLRKGKYADLEKPFNAVIKGPLGELSMEIPTFVAIERSEDGGAVTVSVEDRKVRHQREMWGTTRAYLQNHILGVSEGHTAILRFVGVGYRSSIEPTATTVSSEYPGQQFVNLKVGFSHPVELGIPKGVKASTPQPTRLLLEGIEKEVVMSFAAKIRKWRPPEPYKGKGIFVNGETIRLKAKKIK